MAKYDRFSTNVSPFTTAPEFVFDCRAVLTRVFDGDSFWVLADTMFGGRHEPELRLKDVWAPERGELGFAATTQFVLDWMDKVNHSLPRRKWPLYIITHQTKTQEPEQKRTFTRYLAEVWPYDDRSKSLNEALRGFLEQNGWSNQPS